MPDPIQRGGRLTRRFPATSPQNHSVTAPLVLALTLSALAPAGVAAQSTDLTATATAASRPPVQIIRVVTPGGFRWGDAGIGAAGGIGLSIAVAGGGLLIAQRHGRRASGSRPVRNVEAEISPNQQEQK